MYISSVKCLDSMQIAGEGDDRWKRCFLQDDRDTCSSMLHDRKAAFP